MKRYIGKRAFEWSSRCPVVSLLQLYCVRLAPGDDPHYGGHG